MKGEVYDKRAVLYYTALQERDTESLYRERRVRARSQRYVRPSYGRRPRRRHHSVFRRCVWFGAVVALEG